MSILFKTVISVLLSLVNVFTVSVFGTVESKDAYKVQNEDEILLNFAAISDVHMTDGFAHAQMLKCGLADMENAQNELDALVLAGDITDHGLVEEYENLQKAFESFSPAKEILMAVGNHDTWTDDNDRYEPAKENFVKYSKEITGRELTQCYYSTEINGYSFIVMASEGTNVAAYISETQLEWLRAEMDKAAEKDLPIFVICHWPVAQSHGLPETFGEEEPSILDGSLGEQTYAVEEILKDYENVFMISGHIHNGLSNAGQSELYGYSSVESDGTFHSINLPSFMYMSSRGSMLSGCGYSIEVYEDEVVVRARSFTSGMWQSDYDVTIPIM
ncbi:MAG: metallophosphoesterase [Clostridia bacterium]|nr:metallophosphoesterase [Clostridia bacterium]